jgi:hypothetical protein
VVSADRINALRCLLLFCSKIYKNSRDIFSTSSLSAVALDLKKSKLIQPDKPKNNVRSPICDTGFPFIDSSHSISLFYLVLLTFFQKAMTVILRATI